MDGEKNEQPIVEVTDATSVVAKDATESGDTDEISSNIKLEAFKEPSADSIAPITSYQIKPVLQDK